ncbi:MAG: flagellar brake protein [Lachnospiraceae bacterium]|nr:flagellar brake protein [Lachnospiraceae bacterium]
MLTKYVIPGNKVDIQALETEQPEDELEKKKVYQTRVYDVLSDDRLEIYMPMEKAKLILLPVEVEYDLCFYTSAGLYQCYARVADRYKSGETYILLMELTSNLRKHQRREYYRLSCALEMNGRALEKEEVQAVEKREPYLIPGLPLSRGIIVDISGGGIRFVSSHAYEPESLVCCKYNLLINGNFKEYTLIIRIIAVKELEDKPGVYEHRAQYINIDAIDREEIIKYIFEEDRKNRKREKKY